MDNELNSDSGDFSKLGSLLDRKLDSKLNPIHRRLDDLDKAVRGAYEAPEKGILARIAKNEVRIKTMEETDASRKRALWSLLTLNGGAGIVFVIHYLSQIFRAGGS